jgi:predicted metalloprotease with PDZ domain
MRRVFLVGLLIGCALALLSGRAPGAEAPRPIELSLDASQAPRRLLKSHLVIPAKPGALTLYYPRWIPGEHGPTGPIADLSGLQVSAGGKPLDWKRDDVDLHAFHVTVPEGADAVEVRLEYLAPTARALGTAAASMTARLAVLNWHHVVLYPKGQPVREIAVRANLRLPEGWKLGTALPIEQNIDALVRFKAVSLETLIDSPVLCGQHLKEVPLGPDKGPPHYLVLACDSAAGLAISDELKDHYSRLVAEAGALFGARHYRAYRFLVAMSDKIAHFALEHHEASDNRVPERFLLDGVYRKLWTAWVLPHEYVHSWNGKYRRPKGLTLDDYQKPQRTRLLWVYEGLTQYLGYVLAARSGLYTKALSLDNLARVVDDARNTGGRTWRPLEDATATAPHLYWARDDWGLRRRKAGDFYDEGALLWLDADTLIRQKTAGKKSLDDFCRAFYGGKDGPPEVRPYTLDELLKALNGVLEHDWKAFLERHLKGKGKEPVVDGLERAGWKVAYRDRRSTLLEARENEDKVVDLTSSVGVLLKDDGTILDVAPGKAADRAGVGPGMKLVAVNGRRWSTERLRQAVAATRTGKAGVRLLLENGDFFKTYALDYAGGERYPHLERAGKADLLADIFRPRTGKAR